MTKKATLKPIVYRPMFTTRQMLRLRLMKWLIQNGKVSDG